MALAFEYITQARPGGKFEKKQITAINQSAAEKKLMDSQIPCLSIRKLGKKTKKSKKIKMKDLELFAQQMQTTQEVQMNIVQALELAQQMSRKKWVGDVMDGMKKAVINGNSLTDAMRKSNAFDDLTLGLVNAGEKAGFLDRTFQQIKELTRRNLMVKNKVISLMIYPAIVVCIAIGSIFVLMWKTVPVFAGMYKESNMTLPAPTQMMISLSDFVTQQTIPAALVSAGIIFFFMKIPAIYRAIPELHGPVMRLPGVGMVQKKLMQSTFTRTLSDMLGAQTRIVEALFLCRDVSTNYVYKGHVARAIIAVAKGNKLGKAFEPAEDVFGPMMIKALTFGDQTGKIEEILSPMSSALDRELGEYIDQLKTVMEPILTVFIGGIVLFVMLALFIPVFNMSKLI
jgi:type II secretory pathway component PulF